MILKIKAMGCRSDEIFATVECEDAIAGRLIFKSDEWDAFIAALRAGAPNAGVTLNIKEDIDDDIPVHAQDANDRSEFSLDD